MRMPWGKHRGEDIEEIESSYLVWCVESCESLSNDLYFEIRAELASRFGAPRESPPPPPRGRNGACPDPEAVQALVKAGLKTLARKHHPDAGGDLLKMQRLNAAADWLRGLAEK